jgi:hypothetical protein
MAEKKKVQTEKLSMAGSKEDIADYIFNSTRLFFSRPSLVLFGAAG